jgi:hypothetical protein
VQVVGNTATRAGGQAVRVATYAVDAFDTVKDYYTDLYRKWRQRKEDEAKTHEAVNHKGVLINRPKENLISSEEND